MTRWVMLLLALTVSGTSYAAWFKGHGVPNSVGSCFNGLDFSQSCDSGYLGVIGR